MTARNDITGQFIRSRPNSKTYQSNWDKIFGSKEKKNEDPIQEKPKVPPLFLEAIGWTHAQCCIWLEEGKDPRTEDCAELIDMAIKDLLLENQDEEGIKEDQ